MSFGQTYPDWCPSFSGKETRACKRIINKQNNYTVDLEFATETGPIKLVIYKNGNTFKDEYFEHSVSGMEKALNYTKQLIK